MTESSCLGRERKGRPQSRKNNHVSSLAAVSTGLLVICSAIGCAGRDRNSDGPPVSPDAQDVLAFDSGSEVDASEADTSEADMSGAEMDSGVTEEPQYGPPGAEATDELCDNGLDDDENSYPDCEDFWCRETTTVTVCESLENTVELCTDEIDNGESPRFAGDVVFDGLIDCADPDCLKNPLLDVCSELSHELGNDACSNDADDDGDGLIDCADLDCLHASMSTCPLDGGQRVLVDNAHRQQAGSADGVVDVPSAHPWPTQPVSETDWAGQLSSFGFDLTQTGDYIVETLPQGSGRLTFSDATNTQDLSHYDVLVVPEASAPFTEGEAEAVFAFVQAGGGLLLVVDHLESDRDGNSWDSVQVWNDVFQTMGSGDAATNPFGFVVRDVDHEESGELNGLSGNVANTIPSGLETHSVLAGRHGQVQDIGFYRGGLFTTFDAVNSTVTVLIHAVSLDTAGYEDGSAFVVVTEYGEGRVVGVGNSALMNDGTDSHGIEDVHFDSWNDASLQNAALFLNAVDWLAE